MVQNLCGRFSALLVVMVGLLLTSSASAQNEVVVPVPYAQKNETIPHPVHAGAYVTLKAYVRNATCAAGYSVCWDVNRNGNYDDDWCRTVGPDGNTTLWDIGRTLVVPAVATDSTLNYSVRVRNTCNANVNTRDKYATYRMFVYNWTPADDPRLWTQDQLEILQVEAVDEGMWYNHRTMVNRAGNNTNSITGQCPFVEGTGLYLWLYTINGHLPAYPPNTYTYPANDPPPNGFLAENDRRWSVDPYAESAIRLMNDLTSGANVAGVPAMDEDNTCGYDAVTNAQNRCARLGGTTDQRGAYSSRGAGTYQMGINGGAVATCLPSMAGTRIQNGPLAGNRYEWFAQQMADYLGYAQGDGGAFYGSWYYNPVDTANQMAIPTPPETAISNPAYGTTGGDWASYSDLSTMQWALVGMDGIDEAGKDYGIVVSNRHKYRVAEQLVIGQRADLGMSYANAFATSDVKLTGGAILGARWIGLNALANDNFVPYPPYSKWPRSKLLATYNGLMTFAGNNWNVRRPSGPVGWLDGFWQYGDPLCGDTSGLYSQPRCGNTYAIYSNQKGYRTGQPAITMVGGHDWNRDFSTYYLRAMDRTLDPANPLTGYDLFGRIVDDYCELWGVTCGYGPGYFGSAMGSLVLTPTIFHPKPVALAQVDQTQVFAGCAGGTNGKVIFDHSNSFHPNFAARIIKYQWDVDAANGLWWNVANAAKDYETPGADGVIGQIFEYTYMNPGTYTATLRVIDDVGENKMNTVQVTVLGNPNVAPSAQAGTGYVIETGEALQLAGTAADINLACGDVMTVSWDLNNDNVFGDAGANRADFLVPWASISALPQGVANTIKMKVRDSAGLEQISTTTLTIYPSAPVISLRANPTTARCGDTVFFDASRSYTPNPLRQIVKYDWDVDGKVGSDGLGPVFSYTYLKFGIYNVTLTITDDRGRTASAQTVINVNLGNVAPVARISQATYSVLSGEDLTIDGSRSSDDNETCGDRIVSYKWDMNNNGQYADLGVDVSGATTILPWQYLSQRMRWPASRETGQPNNPIRLLVTDTFGQTATSDAQILIYNADPVADFEQTPNPAPVNVRTGNVIMFLDGRASHSPIPGVSITRIDWDTNDDGQMDVLNTNAVQAARVLNPIPADQDHVPQLFVRIHVVDSTGRATTTRKEVFAHVPPTPPTADADPSDVPETGYNILLGQGLQLNGAGSFDPDAADFGDFVAWYRWDLNWHDGDPFNADLTMHDENSDAVEAVKDLTVQDLTNFGIAGVGHYQVKLEVEDSTGQKNWDTAPIVVHPVDPTARYTMDANNIECGGSVTLDARASFHPHPAVRIVSYQWDLDNDGQFDDADGAVVQARYDQFTFGVRKTIRLQITDSLGHTATASSQLLVDLGNRAPTAIAGGNRDANGNIIGPYVIARGENLQLSAAGSADPDTACGDAIVRYQWDLKNDGTFEFDRVDTSVPLITAAQLTAFGMNAVGTYDIKLRVTDKFGVTSEQIVPFRVANGPTAVAAATPNRVACNAQVTFDASASTTDGPLGQGFDLVDFVWDLDNDGRFNDANGVRTTRNAFALPDVNGNVTMNPRVQVTDIMGRKSVASTSVTINPQNLAPIAAAGGPYTTGPVGAGYQPITLDGRASYDPDEPCDGITVAKWDIDGDGLFGADDNPAEPVGMLVPNFTSPLWRPNTTQTVKLKVCDMRNTCSKVDEADVQIRPSAPPLGQLLSPLAANAACMGVGAFDITFNISDPSGRPVTATANIAGIDRVSKVIPTPANGSMVASSLHIDPVAMAIPEGRHLIIVKFANDQGGKSQVDAGDRILFDRTAPVITLGAQLVANACYTAASVPRPTVGVVDTWDPVPTLTSDTASNVCARTFTVSARDACGNSSTQSRAYYVAESVPVAINGVAEGALVNTAQLTWTVGGAAQCHPTVTTTTSKDGAAAVPYLSNAMINQPGGYVFAMSVSDCANQARPYARRFTINAPPVAVPIPAGHPQADTGRANTYHVKQGDQLIVDASDSRPPESFDHIVSYAWDWTADGTVDANTRTATYPTPSQGSFDGTLKVTDTANASGVTPFRVVIDDVNPLCIPGGPYVVFSRNAFTADASNSRPGAANEPITAYDWHWDDNSADTHGVRAPHTYQDSGNYFLRLTCHDQDSTSVGTVRVDVRDVSPIITRFTPPAIVYEVIPQQYTVEAIPALANDPITAYEWDFFDDDHPEYRGLDKGTITHQIREYTQPGTPEPLAIRVYDTDTRGVRKYTLDVKEATFTVLLNWLSTKTAAAIANPAYNAQQKVSLLDIQTYIDRALWGEQYSQRAITFLAMDTIMSKLVAAQIRGIDFGDELWAFAREAWRELDRQEKQIKARPGVQINDPDLVKAHAAIVVANQWSVAAWETKVRSAANAMVAVDDWAKVLEAYNYFRHFDAAFKNGCDAAPLKAIVDPVARRQQWQAIKDQLAVDMNGVVGEMNLYLAAGMSDNRPGPGRVLLQGAYQSLVEATDIAKENIGRICGAGQTCASEPKEIRYAAQLASYKRAIASLAGAGAYTTQWETVADAAAKCRNDLSILYTEDANANANYIGGFPVRTVDTYWFDVPGESEQVVAETNDGRGGCAATMDTRIVIYRINGVARAGVPGAQNDNMSAIRKCSRLDVLLPRGRYELVVDRPGGLAGLDFYNLTLTHIRADGCGDRRVTAGEECDDGNLVNGDGCSALCRVESTGVDVGGDFRGSFAAGAFDRYSFTLNIRRTMTALVSDGQGGCPGDARMFLSKTQAAGLPLQIASDDDSGPGPCPQIVMQLDPGSYELKVDGANRAALAAYVLTVNFAGACGDGTVDPGEGCDDRNLNNGDGCSKVCTLEGVCGNGAIDPGELCDDGNRANGDGCDMNCMQEVGPVCGNGRVEAGEACDDGNRINGDGCSAVCVREPRCGNRIVDQGEQCDDGNLNPGDGCSALCQTELPCGNTKLNPGEQCDDGNVNNGDGCDAQCRIEATNIIVSQKRIQSAIVARGANWFTFHADTTSSVNIETSNGAGGCLFDTIATLYRKSGGNAVQVARDDDAGIELCSRISVRIGAGDYLLRIEARNGVPLPAYALDYRLDVNVSLPGMFNGAFEANGNDMFAFTTGAPKHLHVVTDDGAGACPGDTAISLRRRNADGTRPEVANNDNANGTNCAALDLDLPTNSYEMIVTGSAALPAYKINVAFGIPVGTCGNGVRDGAEECDDGNVVVGDGCDAQCRYECGNSRLDRNETCDDGNRVANDGCSAVCQNEGTCGNNIVEPGEACDDGNRVNGDGCEANCSLRAGCGNHAINAGELCDDGNLVNGDGCDVLCSTEVIPVDKGIVDLVNAIPAGRKDTYTFKTETETKVRFETTDGAAGCPGNTVLNLYSVAANGTRNLLSTDDDGGVNGCSLLLRTIPTGSFAVDVLAPAAAPLMRYTLRFRAAVDVSLGGGYAGGFDKTGTDVFTANLAQAGRIILETSDGLGGCPGDTVATLYRAGNPVALMQDDNNGPGPCSRIYYPAAAGANADPGNYDVVVAGRNGIAVRAYAVAVSFARCGDRVVNIGEQCDDGNVANGDGCDSLCRLENLCGNGRINPPEQCDDGNRNNGDGCSQDCVTEVLCGNGHLDAGEQCDDANLVDGDGCDHLCHAEVPACGNGRVEGAETCDDGNVVNGDGCSAQCIIEQVCGNNRLEGTEQCDDGNAIDGDGCSAACLREFYPILTGRFSQSSQLARNMTDVYRFTADGRSNLTIETKTGVTNGVSECVAIDTEVLLYSINAVTGVKTLVTSNDDARVGYRCSLINRAINAGSYEFVVRGKLGAAVPGYVMDFRVAQNVTAAAVYIGSVQISGTDLFEFRTAAAARYTLTTSDGAGGCPGDTVLTLYRNEANGTRTQLQVADGGGPGLCSQILSFQTVANVLYEVESIGKNGIRIQSYRFQSQLR